MSGERENLRPGGCFLGLTRLIESHKKLERAKEGGESEENDGGEKSKLMFPTDLSNVAKSNEGKEKIFPPHSFSPLSFLGGSLLPSSLLSFLLRLFHHISWKERISIKRHPWKRGRGRSKTCFLVRVSAKRFQGQRERGRGGEREG